MAMTASPGRRQAPWRGRKHATDVKDRNIKVRCSSAQYEIIAGSAEQAGLSVGGFLRAIGTGSPGPRSVRRPPVEKVALARLLGEIGKLGSNVNQIARHTNATKDPPSWYELMTIRQDISALRAAVMQALGRDPGGESGDGH